MVLFFDYPREVAWQIVDRSHDRCAIQLGPSSMLLMSATCFCTAMAATTFHAATGSHDFARVMVTDEMGKGPDQSSRRAEEIALLRACLRLRLALQFTRRRE